MEILKAFEDSHELTRVTFDSSFDLSEAVKLSFEADELTFNKVEESEPVDVATEEVEEEPEGPKLQISEKEKKEILDWVQKVYSRRINQGIADAAENIWNHVHAADITYEELEKLVNSLYKRLKKMGIS